MVVVVVGYFGRFFWVAVTAAAAAVALSPSSPPLRS